ncbi:MAG: methyltransferase domain-containing protein [Alphaproteobacteria bacterium]
MHDLALLIDLHLDADRQGPGGDDETRLAMALSRLRGTRGLRIADIGCGTGASALLLAQDLDANVTAIDLLPEFVKRLETRAAERGLEDRIETKVASMDALPFGDRSLDAIWSEGAIYNIGFENGIRAWRRFLRPGGILAVSDLTWLTHDRPPDLESHWRTQYPGVATAAEKLAALETNGYSPVGYFSLPAHCWLENYYRPMQRRFSNFLERNANSESARAIVSAEEKEIALYEHHFSHFGYGYFIARRTA